MEQNKRLTSAELSQLWTSYMNDSMAICVISYFLTYVEDEEVHSVLHDALALSEKHLEEITDIFNTVNQPIPQGFTDSDVDLKAPRLFSDTFSLIYLQNMARLGLMAYSLAFPLMTRKDVINYYDKCLASSAKLITKLTDIMLRRGIYSRSPYIPTTEQVEFIENQGYMHGYFAKRRPVNSVEITAIFVCLMSNIFGKVLLTGYAQVAKSKKVREYMSRGVKIATKQTEVLESILKEGSLSSPSTWDSEVTTSTVAPFSDKLMMYHTRALSVASIANYGAATSTAMRHDLIPHFFRLTTEMGKFGDDGAELMIEHNWFEEPPSAPDRKRIVRERKKE
ncbi:DUF3231 family protein [Virgibacillus ndiopensis]|uniref:DUF3231 family protein n=1 Tax=Virgibacillus ndiopensis TaxID=2004408 RepID=UPI00159BEFA6|nr:DUF3231 family protein [Virgibacillus ndiopensis]